MHRSVRIEEQHRNGEVILNHQEHQEHQDHQEMQRSECKKNSGVISACHSSRRIFEFEFPGVLGR
jgi:hypothetical protein